nr:DNA-directed DNA polymerase [Tanacetum cinerariifolium]
MMEKEVQARGREAAVGMTWAEFKALLREEFCLSNEMEKLESKFCNNTMVGANHAGYTDWFHDLAKLVTHLVTFESKRIERYINRLAPQIHRMIQVTQPTTIQSDIFKAGILTNNAVRCGTLTRRSEKRKEVDETSKQVGSWNDNKKAKAGKGLWQQLLLEMKIWAHIIIKQVAPVSAVRMGNNQRVCYKCGSFEHLRNTYPKLNRAPGQAGNRLALEGNQNTRNDRNHARGRAFSVNAVDALQDPNVVTGTFSLNNHFATVLFDSGDDFSFISTKFAPLLNVKPSIVSPGYGIKVANGKKEVDRIISDCKLELENSLFTIDLILLRHGSFDVIVGMDWLSKNKAEIVCHEKTKEDHEVHLKLVLELLKKERLNAKFSKCEFWLQEIMAASAIIISFDSSDESVGSPPSRVILFGDIPTVIPSTSVIAQETYAIAHLFHLPLLWLRRLLSLHPLDCVAWDVPNDAIKLMLFPYSLEGTARICKTVDKLADQISNLVEIVNKQVIAPAKAVEKTSVTCGGAHAYYDCIATDRSFFQNQPSTLGTIPSNTMPNPKGEMKAVTTRSGLAYEEPSIPTNSPLEKVDEQNTEEILDKEHSNSSGSTAQVQPLVVPILIAKPDVPRTQTKPTIPYPSSFTDALLLMPKFASTIKSLLANKDKLFKLAKVSLNENCSAMLLKELLEKLGDPGKFLVPCDFPGMELSLQELTPTWMTLELADRSITHPKGVSEDIFVKVGKFHFPTDIVVVDFEADPRVPLILRRSFLRTVRALIDVYGEEITLREPIVKSSSPTLTPFGESDFFLEEIEDFLNDDSIPVGIENSVYDPEGDILFLKKLLNEDPFQLPPMDLKLAKESKAKSSVEEPPELELKELTSHLEYALLEDSNKLPVIIAKNLKDVERDALINVLKSYKRAIAWKISNIKGINPRFYTHNILMEDDYKPAVQSQRWVNPKIYDVIKKELIKLLDAGMIHPIFDSQWVSPIHCVPKKGGMTVVANENNELIQTRLVTGWRVCIDYRKLNDATRKDHFSLPFMDQMLERLAGNEFYCFLDGFLGYFQIPIDPQDQEKTTFACPYGTFAYQRMPFGLCNAPGIVLGHKISKSGIEVDRAKVDVIAKIPHPTTVKDSYSPDVIASPEYITPLPATLPFLFIDSSEDSDPSDASDSFEAPPSQDLYVTTIARWRSRVTTRSSSPSDFPIAPVTAPPRTRRRA